MTWRPGARNMTPASQPRSRMHLFLRGLGWLAIVPLLIALVTGAIALFEGRKAERLRDSGTMAEAVITGKEVKVSYNSEGNRTTTFYLSFRFAHLTGTMTDTRSVGRRFFNRQSVGDETPVRYWTVDPSVNEIEPGSTRRTLWITKIISAVTLSGGGLWSYLAWAKAGRLIWLRDHGERRKATVTEHFRTKVRVNNRPRYRLVWRDSEGLEGRSFMMPHGGLEGFPTGTELAVFVDPGGRLPPVWEGDVGPARRAGAVRRS